VAEGLEVRRSGIRGRGCFATSGFAPRGKIALYAGEVVRGRRTIEARLRRQDSIAIIRLNEDMAVDGATGGDETMFINHSCEPNAFMRKVSSEKVAFFALRDIRPGEEITMDYRDPDHPEVCRCGARRCRSERR
jgi:SET domain-containing protein